jgi:hypothetical protein
MNKIILAFLALILFHGCVPVENNTASEITENPAAQSVQGEGEWWLERDQAIVSRLAKDPELILLGNSIFHSLNDENRQRVWERYLDQYRTENVIWRLQNGTLDLIQLF